MTLYFSGAQSEAASDRGGAEWSATSYGRWRLAAEIEAMRRFPGFALCVLDEGHLGWEGVLRSTFCPDREYLLEVAYPDRFPRSAPVVIIVKPQLHREAPHVLCRGMPCLYRGGCDSRNGYDPARTTAATLVAWTALWIHAYETWQYTGEWPGRED
ncbi:MAG: hypothetical protein JXA87_07005 [Thermoleophilia bacterium]|nr:hypothetical protein [Thermoleophilia bacterium]